VKNDIVDAHIRRLGAEVSAHKVLIQRSEAARDHAISDYRRIEQRYLATLARIRELESELSFSNALNQRSDTIIKTIEAKAIQAIKDAEVKAQKRHLPSSIAVVAPEWFELHARRCVRAEHEGICYATVTLVRSDYPDARVIVTG